jgi:hypothetical protein
MGGYSEKSTQNRLMPEKNVVLLVGGLHHRYL